MPTLYVIGNGFDLFHNLRTSYSDFNKYVVSNEINFGDASQFFEFSVGENGLWCDFENDLGSFDADHYFDYHNEIDVTRDNFRPSEVYGLEDELTNQSEDLVSGIQDTFLEWVEQIDLSTERLINGFLPSDSFLSFNYTPTLESVYSVRKSQICYVHGCVTDTSELIFGHGISIEPEPEIDENGDSLRTMFSDAQGNAGIPLAMLQKPVEEMLSKHEQFFKRQNNLDSVIVLGHSLSDVDLPYFQLINKNNPNAAWAVSFYMEYEKTKIYTQLEKAGISSDRIDLIKMEDLCQ